MTATEVQLLTDAVRQQNNFSSLLFRELNQELYARWHAQQQAERAELIRINSALHRNQSRFMQTNNEIWAIGSSPQRSRSISENVANPVHLEAVPLFDEFTRKWGALAEEERLVSNAIKGIITITHCCTDLEKIFPAKLHPIIRKYIRMWPQPPDGMGALKSYELKDLLDRYKPHLALLRERLTKNLLGVL
jgi:hypothetical protein